MTILLLVAAVAMLASVAGAQHIPHQSTGQPYDDELYRHLIFDHSEDGHEQSWVLPYTNPWFYIRLGSATACNHAWRVTWNEFHFWRAIVPVVAEQLTGEEYRGRVEVGCEDRQPEYGWVIVNYVTPAEYEAETGREWGADVWARARVGSTYGKIWMGYDGRPLRRPTSDVQDLIIHEIGHAFGLNHTTRRGSVMQRSYYPEPGSRVPVFTWKEEGAARRAYRAGRGARYCGDPDRCGNGFAPGYVPSMRGLEAPIAAYRRVD